jgi:DNA invertase Pin-like site-specific DNA recombinase
MTSAYGYLRPCFGEPAEEAVRVREQAIREFCRSQGWELGELFADEPSTRRERWLERPAGRRLAERVQSGDHVVVAGAWSVWTTADDLLEVLQDWQERGIILDLIPSGTDHDRGAMNLPTEGGMGRALVWGLSWCRYLDSLRRSEAIRTALWQRRGRGARHCRNAPYGYRWSGEKGAEQLVANEQEQAVIRRIAEMRDSGLSWHRIAATLMQEKVKTPSGAEWSPDRVRRAYRRWVADLRSGDLAIPSGSALEG